MLMPKQKRNWTIDAILFIGLLATFFLDWTGLFWHQWLAVGLGALALLHLVLHWSWVVAVGKRFRSSPHQSRTYYLVDGILLVNFTLIGVSGLVISTWFNLALERYLLWKDLHIYSSIASLVLILLKIGLHWRWIVKTAARYFGIWNQPVPAPAAITAARSQRTKTMDRREFLQLMGVAGIASLISASNLLELGDETSQSITKSRYYGSVDPELDFRSQTIPECSPVCDQGCSYPGQCRRYIDRNNNGICDLTECPDSPAADGKTEAGEQALSAPSSPPQSQAEAAAANEEGCLVLCPRACSYPGQCPDYLDANGNNLCDYGECLAVNQELPAPAIAHDGSGGGRRRRGN